MYTKPFAVTGCAYSYTSTRLVVPPLATPPSDFSRMVVSPPALLPGEGLLFISLPLRAVYSSHHLMRRMSFSPTSFDTAPRGQQGSGPENFGGLHREGG